MKIIKLIPDVKDNLWGGTKLSTDFGIYTDKDIRGEAWMLSCHPDGENHIFDSADNSTLTEYLKENPSYLGTNCEKYDYFPLLIKLIDAKDNLSLRVHPDDEYSGKYENQLGKTECWYILDAEDGSEIIYGLSEEMTRDELEKSIEENTILEKVRHVKAQKGDFFFIPSGTIHAIGKGILLAEVQRNSNVTYRVYDYNRGRELHKKKACDVITLKPLENEKTPVETVRKEGFKETELVKCNLFETKILDIEESCTLEADEKSFVSLVALDGNSVVEANETFMTLYKGESIFVPASFGKFKILGSSSILVTTVE